MTDSINVVGSGLIGRAFTAKGRGFEPCAEGEIGDLPVVADANVEGRIVLFAERLLSDEAGNWDLAVRPMPMAGSKDRDAWTCKVQV